MMVLGLLSEGMCVLGPNWPQSSDPGLEDFLPGHAALAGGEVAGILGCSTHRVAGNRPVEETLKPQRALNMPLRLSQYGSIWSETPAPKSSG